VSVGSGRGDWITETTYKYVGYGAGDLAVVVQQKRNYMPCFALAVLLVAVVVVAVAFMPSTPVTTVVKSNFLSTPPPTSRPAPPPMTLPTTPALEKTCSFWGDPHVLTFDGARPSFYGDGEYWIVKNKDVSIQGRYMGTKYTYGLAATQKVAIAGPFLQGNVIEVEPMEHAYGGHILVNGQPVLTSFGTLQVGPAFINYNGIGELVDEAASKWTTRAVHLELPMGIHMTVFRWGNYLDMKITMKALEGGQDGSCGNFNGDPVDDTTEAIFNRIGARVESSAMLFSSRAEISFTTEEQEMLRTQCPARTMVDAELKCRQNLPQSAMVLQVNACVFDVCFGMNEHALRSAATYASAADQAAASSG